MKDYTCPRCGQMIPNNREPGAYPGALSRYDNETEICSGCGRAEAWLSMERGVHTLHPVDGYVLWERPPATN